MAVMQVVAINISPGQGEAFQALFAEGSAITQ